MASRNLAMSGRQWPASPVMELHQELDRLFGSMFGGWGTGGSPSVAAMPQMEMCEQGPELCVSVELPGVLQEDVDVRLMGDTLVISGEKKSSTAQQGSNMHMSERSYGRFQRGITLPFTPDPERTQASLENGVLTVRLGRMPEGAGSRRIEVRSGQGAASSTLHVQGQTQGQGQRLSGGAGAASAAGSTGSAGSEGDEQSPP